MRALFLTFIIFSSFTLYGQIDPDIKEILSLIPEKLSEKEKIYYTQVDTFHSRIVKEWDLNTGLIPKYKIDTISDISYVKDSVTKDLLIIDSIVLTQDEKKYIFHLLDNPDTTNWLKNYFPQVIKIQEDSLNNIFSNSLIDGWNDFYKKYADCFYSFSNPIFIRNNSICLIYTSEHCAPLGANGALLVYIKVNGVWEYFSQVGTWIS